MSGALPPRPASRPDLPEAPASHSSTATIPGLGEFGLATELVRSAAAIGWAAATAIQSTAIPAILQGRDVLGLAPTGSGKTAAFLLPMLQRLLADPAALDERPRRLRALILAPTRELAIQIGDVVRQLAPRLKSLVAVGGVPINPQMMALRGGAHLVVATPGRLLDLTDRHALSLSEVGLLVLDEADRLLDLGFAGEIGRVLALLPVRRQTLMFSATMPAAVATLAGQALHDALRLETPAADPAVTPHLSQRAIAVDAARRTLLLRHLITSEAWDRVLVFVASQYATEHVAEKLRRAGLPAAALHGQLSQGRRSQVLADFRSGALTALVATDLAARGIDVVQLAAVVNFDLPRSVVDYTHRIGRTARAGAHGTAVSFICADVPGSEAHFRLIEKRRQQWLVREQVPGFEPAAGATPPAPSDANGGIKGRRKSKKDKLREATSMTRRG